MNRPPHYKECVRLFLNINQLDELNFIISLFQASTCFEHISFKYRNYCNDFTLNIVNHFQSKQIALFFLNIMLC